MEHILQEMGDFSLKKKSKKISIYPDTQLYDLIKNFSVKYNYSMNKLVLTIIKNGIVDLQENGLGSLLNVLIESDEI